MAAQEESLLQCADAFHFVGEDGTPVLVSKGQIVRVGHPMLEGREHLFAPLTVDFEHEVNSAGRRGKHAPVTPPTS